MMSAKEMFEKLGFEQTENDDNFIEYQRDDGDQHAEITFSLKDKTFRAIYGRYEFGMTFHYVTSDELKAINKQVKELGWIEEEIKQETNFEHYKDEVIRTSFHFAVKNGDTMTCLECDCRNCLFHNDGLSCDTKKVEWLCAKYKAEYKLTQFEFDLLNAYKNSGMRQCISNYGTLLELHKKGYFKDIDFSIPIHKILENYEIKGEEKND